MPRAHICTFVESAFDPEKLVCIVPGCWVTKPKPFSASVTIPAEAADAPTSDDAPQDKDKVREP